MKIGGNNDLHIDNYSKEYKNDYSAILYLNDSYNNGINNILIPIFDKIIVTISLILSSTFDNSDIYIIYIIYSILFI
jgi:hypothetical protein